MKHGRPLQGSCLPESHLHSTTNHLPEPDRSSSLCAMRINKTHLLFLIILIEGYVVLASELLAIRQLVPFVGSGTETVSIVIGAVLMPLAIGYHAGGLAYKKAFAKRQRKGKKRDSIRVLLLKNILIALAILGIGLSYAFMETFFTTITALGITHRLLQTAIYASLFLVTPVFLLGQTVPLVSHYFSHRKLNEITGRMLFFSTTGSFFGSIFSTIVLMMWLGVHNTVIVTMALLYALILLLSRRLFGYESVQGLAVMVLIFLLNNNAAMRELHIVSNNAYNMAMVQDVPTEPNSRILVLNRSASSKLSDDPNKHFEYCKYIDGIFIQPIATQGPVRDILVIGAGGFTIGLNDDKNRYTFVDIDKDLQQVAEEHFLRKPLGANKQFVAASARAFVHTETKQYDLILLDAYTNVVSIPMEVITQEFLRDVRVRLKPGGIVISNVISSPSFEDKFTVRYTNTFAEIFPHFTRQIIGDFNPWDAEAGRRPDEMIKVNNVLYIYYDRPYANDTEVYTDDRNSYSIDR